MTPEVLPVTYPDFLAGIRKPEPRPIDMVVLRQACALIDLVRHAGPVEQFEHLAAWTRADPDLVAMVMIVLAGLAMEDVSEPGRVIDMLARYPVDLSLIADQAHSLFYKYGLAKARHHLPNWVWAGERAYQRIAKRRHRARARQARAG